MNPRILLSAGLVMTILCLSGTGYAAPAADRHRAVSLTLWGGGGGSADEHPLTMDNLKLDDLNQTLTDMKQIGVDTVGVNVFWLQDNIDSHAISPDPTDATDFRGTATTDVTTTVIDAIHNKGMKVMLKPLVNLRDDPNHWRGQIPGTANWFWGSSGTPHDGSHTGQADDPYDGYANYIYHWAQVAQTHNVETFCIGTELAGTSGSESNWRKMINGPEGDGGIRSRYNGKLTYAAQHGGAGGGTSTDIQWWDEMDYLGVDAYYPLTNQDDPSLEQLQVAWGDYITMLQQWSAAEDGKPVLFTEVGYCSFDGTNQHPWKVPPDGAVLDLQEQADCYEALLSQLWEESWWAGAHWWNWQIDPDPSDWDQAPLWFTPQNKPAEDVLAEYYIPEPGLLVLAGSGLLLWRRRRR
ncbi:MAG: glycoside hydrolase family 113 [Phycisphaerae bacterium]